MDAERETPSTASEAVLAAQPVPAPQGPVAAKPVVNEPAPEKPLAEALDARPLAAKEQLVAAAVTTAPVADTVAAPHAPAPRAHAPPAPAASNAFTAAGDQFVVTAPANWKRGKTPPTRLAIVLNGPSALPDRNAPPIFRAQVGQQQPNQPARSLDAFTRELVRQVTKQDPDQTKVVPAQIDGVAARQFIVTLEDARSMDIDMKYVVVLKPPRSFIFTYLQERGLFDVDEADAMFASIKWKN